MRFSRKQTTVRKQTPDGENRVPNPPTEEGYTGEVYAPRVNRAVRRFGKGRRV